MPHIDFQSARDAKYQLSKHKQILINWNFFLMKLLCIYDAITLCMYDVWNGAGLLIYFYLFFYAVVVTFYLHILIVFDIVQLFVETQMFSVLSDSRLYNFENERS
jgi:hypothetical protein